MSGFAKIVDEALSAAGRAADGSKVKGAKGALPSLTKEPLPDLNQIKAPKGAFDPDPVPKNNPLFSKEPAPDAFASDPVPTPIPQYETLQKRTVDGLKPFDNPRARQADLLSGDKIHSVSEARIDPEATSKVKEQFTDVMGTEPDDADVALMFGFGTGYNEASSPTQLKFLRESLKVSASLLEVAPELAKLDTTMKYSNGAPMLMWRGTFLTEKGTAGIEENPLASFTFRLDNPTEVGAHAGTFDQARHFAHNTLGGLKNDLDRGRGALFTQGVESLLGRTLPRREQAMARSLANEVAPILEDFLKMGTVFDSETDALMFAGEKGVVSGALDMHALKELRILDDIADVVDTELRKEYRNSPELLATVDNKVKEFKEDLGIKLLQGLTDTDVLNKGKEAKRTGQLVPYVPDIKRPIVFRDVGSNDADSIMKTFQESGDKFTSSPEELSEVAVKYWKKRGTSDTENNKLLAKLLTDAGFDAIQYVNTAEGVGYRVSMVVLDSKTVKPLHEVVPSLGKLKEALRKRVYNMLSVGIPLPLALKIVGMEEENDTAS